MNNNPNNLACALFSVRKLEAGEYPYHIERVFNGNFKKMCQSSFIGNGWETFYISSDGIDAVLAMLLHQKELSEFGSNLYHKHRHLFISGCDYLPDDSPSWFELDQFTDEHITKIARQMGLIDKDAFYKHTPRYWVKK